MASSKRSNNAATTTAAALITLLVCAPALAIDSIPETSGAAGFVLFGYGAYNIESNLLVTGPPLLDEVGNEQIDSIFAAPSSVSAPALPFAAEFNYTFASTRTQLFLGNRLEDLLRLDVSFGLGVRQGLPDESILAVSLLATPEAFKVKVWSDPYVEGEDRVETGRIKPGARLRWGRILGTGLEFTATYREMRHDEERSGDWLIAQGRLDPADQPLLDRNGDVWKVQLLYRLRAGQKNIFEPAIRYQKDNLKGAAMRNEGFALALTHLYVTPKLVLDTNLIYRQIRSVAIHPVYGETLDGVRWGVGFMTLFDLFGAKRWRALASVDYFREDVNIDFFDGTISAVYFGALWRYKRE